MIVLNAQRLRRLRRLALVPRWVVVPTLHKQSVAEHSFHVMHIAMWLYQQSAWGKEAKPNEVWQTLSLMYYAMIHDETEAITGDIPSPAGKNHLPGKSKVYEEKFGHGATGAPEELKQILKMADLLEAWLFVKEDQQLGNDGLWQIEDDIRQRFREIAVDFPTDKEYPSPHYKVNQLVADFYLVYAPSIHPVNEIEEDNGLAIKR